MYTVYSHIATYSITLSLLHIILVSTSDSGVCTDVDPVNCSFIEFGTCDPVSLGAIYDPFCTHSDYVSYVTYKHYIMYVHTYIH